VIAIGLNHVNDIMPLTLLLGGFAAVVNSVLMAVDRRLTGFDPNEDFQPRCRTGMGY
jgi:hypothetical protein